MKTTAIILSMLLFMASFTLMGQSGKTHALIGVDVFNGKSTDLKNMTILIENGKISDIFKTDSKPIPDSINKIVLSGYYVIPGLIDTHVHMGMKGISESTNASRQEFKKWIYSGVTAVRDMGGDARILASENQLINSNEVPGPDIYFSATVGSSDMIAKDLRLKRVTQGLGIDKAGYVIEAKDGMDINQNVTMAVNSKVTGIKFYAGIDASLIKTITAEAHKQGIKSWAHFTVFPDRPIEVVKAGVDVVSHVWGAFWQDEDVDPAARIPFTDTDFKNARSAIFPDDLFVLNTDSPELLLLFDEMKERNVIWDLNYFVPNTETRMIYKKYALAASKAGIVFSTGTDNFNDINENFPSLFDEIECLVIDGILDPRQVLLSATLNGAKVLGIEKSHGSIEKGKMANLVVLKKNPIEQISNIRQIAFTMKNGIIYFRDQYDE